MNETLKKNIKELIKFEENSDKKIYFDNLFKTEFLPEFKKLVKLCISDSEILKAVTYKSSAYSDKSGYFAEVNIDMMLKNNENKLIINDKFEFETSLDIIKMKDNYYKYMRVCDNLDKYIQANHIFKEAISEALELNKNESVTAFYLTEDSGYTSLAFSISVQLISK